MSGPPDLEPLARIAEDVAGEWGLELGPPFALSRYSFVAPAGHDAVLKVTPPEDDESDEEADALAYWSGDGAVRLLRRDGPRRVLLLERARPGSDISDRPDADATAIAVDVGLTLWQPAAEPFRWIGDHVPRWLDNAERSGQEGRELIPLARRLYASLDVGRDVLVHGDFHHHNILRAGERHLAIDPKPMLGEPEYDIPSFLRNPLSYTMTLDVTERRLAGLRSRGARRGADAQVGRDPLRLPRGRRARGRRAASTRADCVTSWLNRSRCRPRSAPLALQAPAGLMPELEEFYGERLGLPVTGADPASLAVGVGETVLELRTVSRRAVLPRRAARPRRPVRGGARLGRPSASSSCRIPRRVTWCSSSRTGTREACYFHDPAGSILELIAHHGRRRGGHSGAVRRRPS